jgi:hypothetical protein
MAVGPDEMVDLDFLQVGLTSGLRRARAELVSLSEANVRKTVKSDQETSKAGKAPNEHDFTRKTTEES